MSSTEFELQSPPSIATKPKSSKIKAKHTVQSLLLTTNPINLNSKNKHNKTALDIAIESDSCEIIKMIHTYKNYQEICSCAIINQFYYSKTDPTIFSSAL